MTWWRYRPTPKKLCWRCRTVVVERQRVLRRAFERRDLDALARVHVRLLRSVSMLEGEPDEKHLAVPCGSVGGCGGPFLAKTKKLADRASDQVDQALRESRGDLADWGLYL